MKKIIKHKKERFAIFRNCAGKQKWKFSLKFYEENKTNVYYNCIDTKCNVNGILKFDNNYNFFLI